MSRHLVLALIAKTDNMKNRRSTAVTISLLLVLVFAVMQTSRMAKAQFDFEYSGRPIITIHSPNADEMTSPNVEVVFTIEKPELAWAQNLQGHYNKLKSVQIMIDGFTYDSITVDSTLSSPYDYSTSLDVSTGGNHTLTIEAQCEGWAIYYPRTYLDHPVDYLTSESLSFAVDLPLPSGPDSVSQDSFQENIAPIAIIAGIVAGILVVGILAYGAKYKGWK